MRRARDRKASRHVFAGVHSRLGTETIWLAEDGTPRPVIGGLDAAPSPSGLRRPADWGLDPDRGVGAFDGTRGFAVPASQLVEIFGPDWRRTVYA